MIVKERKAIESVSDFFSRIERMKGSSTTVNFYRGHADKTFELAPSLFRKREHRKDEKNVFRELISLHPSEFEADRSVFEQLVRMQHFSLPTRLLDITSNPLVALYFACKSHKDKDAHFLRFMVEKRRIRYYDSDTVSCVSNLSNLTGKERDELRRIDDAAILRDHSQAGKRLLQFIKAEKAYFLPEMQPSDLKSILTVRPKQNNRRILAQQGAFFLFGLTTKLVDTNDFGISIVRTPIPASAKGKILRDLDKININDSSLFPEIESAAKYIMSKLVPVGDEDELI